MSASVIRHQRAARFESLKPACQILILHEDFPAYTRAVEACRRIMEQFADELDFDIKCWNFIELADPACARHAAKTAGTADIILLSVQTPELPPVFDQWLTLFFAGRSGTDGALALVLNESDRPPLALKKLLARLEQMAGRMGMDFVPLPAGNEAAFVETLPSEDWSELAVPLQISDHPQADHWGLNE